MQVMEWVREASADGKTLIAGVGVESVHETVYLANRAAEAGERGEMPFALFVEIVEIADMQPLAGEFDGEAASAWIM